MDIQYIRRLVDLLKKADITEIEVEDGETRVRISRTVTLTAPMVTAQPVPSVAMATIPSALPAPAPTPEVPQGHIIKAPMVGTFYRAPAPEAKPFVQEGDTVKAGQTLCIIEAMKLLNEIESDVPGKVVKILVENGQPVEYGEPLFIVDQRA